MSNRGYSGYAEINVSMVCSECGGRLQMKDGSQLGEKHGQHEIGPVKTFHIVPCKSCIEKEVGPARELSRAVLAMAKVMEGEV